ncbi:MAG: helix-turn-helix transcriptional regulator [Clostridia bacterium]|jgi:transcriptional regulator with XRE-family HTH domain|nr:helix-turn-helix transcriptional regulator [Clostridia bacterium]
MNGKTNNVKKYNGKLNVIGNQIQCLRIEKHLSLYQLSNMLQLIGIDIPKPSLQNIESGKRIVKEYEFYAICKVLDVPMEKMLENFINELESQ